MKPRLRYVVAVSQTEANELAADFGWDRLQDAVDHLVDVKSPPTDVFYAEMYRVYTVEL